MSKARKRRARKARTRVYRGERVKPTPESLSHYRAWPMQLLLEAGPEGGGIDAADFEAALQIVEAFGALTVGLHIRANAIGELGRGGTHDMSDGDAWRVAVWLDWAGRLPWRDPVVVVEWIEDQRTIPVPALRRACRLWERVRDDHARLRRDGNALDKTLYGVLPMFGQLSVDERNDARRVNLTVQTIRPPTGPTPQTTPPNLLGGPFSPARPTFHAHATAAPPSSRQRR